MILCALADLDEPRAKGPFVVEIDGERKLVFVVRKGEAVRAYVDSCPHVGAPLEPVPDQFLDLTKTEIICSLHGARFNMKTGACTWGPCKGRSLTSVPIYILDGMVCTGLSPEV